MAQHDHDHILNHESSRDTSEPSVASLVECSETTSEATLAQDCSQTTSEQTIRDDCSQTSSLDTARLSVSDDGSFASSWSQMDDKVPLEAQSKTLQEFAARGSEMIDELFHETIINGDHCDNNIPTRLLKIMCNLNHKIHSRFEYQETLRSMLHETIRMYNAERSKNNCAKKTCSHN